jgi:glutaredoxin
MRSRIILPSVAAAILVALFATPFGWAQPYRSVSPDGRVTYSDMPPTAADARGGNSDTSNGASATAGLPYELAQVAQKYPVTLYTSQGCTPCDSGRDLLTARGIPFNEKTVNSNDDIEALKKITGNANLPLLTIGGQQLANFQANDWSQYLSTAGYPAASQLPGSYHRPPATPLAPKTLAAAAPKPNVPVAPVENTPTAPPPDPNNPAGIQF